MEQTPEMVLMTKELEEQIPKLYETDGVPMEDKIVYAKYFSPYSGWTWYVFEYSPEEKVFFGFVVGFEEELGYFSLKEFEETNAGKPIPLIERDLYWTPKKFGEVIGTQRKGE